METGMFEKRFKEHLEECGVKLPGGRVLAAVSGGADSVCLLGLLAKLKNRGQIDLRAVHVHHGLRGEEADRDARWVESLCRRMQVPCRVFYEHVEDFAREAHMGQEEAGRLLRYQRLEQEAREWECQEKDKGPVWIAAAHHQGDQAETILHNLCRGSGLKGIGGMEKRRGRLIRPLLEENRREILRWLGEEGLEYCQDSTNFSGKYTRNRIRGQLIPLICSEINPRGVENIARMGKLAYEADQYLSAQAQKWLRDQGKEGPEGILLPSDSLKELPEILRFYAVRLALIRILHSERDLTYFHVEETEGLLEGTTGKMVSLPGGCRAVRTYEGIFVGRTGKQIPAGLPGIKMEIVSDKKRTEFPKKQYTKWFDCDKIKGMPELRFRQKGDYITLPGGGRKLLRRYMIDEKIPAAERDRIPLLADGSHIIWIIGYRISEYYKIGPETVEVLQVSLEDKND